MRSIRGFLLIAACAALPALAGPAAADEQPDETSFAKRVFADNLDKTTEYACFSRHYDAQHMAQHPLQKPLQTIQIFQALLNSVAVFFRTPRAMQ